MPANIEESPTLDDPIRAARMERKRLLLKIQAKILLPWWSRPIPRSWTQRIYNALRLRRV